MCGVNFKFLVFVVFIAISNAATPSFIAKCKTDDTKCLQESTQAAIATFASGLPDNKVEELDPLMFDQVNASSASLDFTLSNVSITGMKGCLAKKVQFDVEKSKMLLDFICNAKIDGNYNMKGRILVLPIDGKGLLHVTLKSLEIHLELDITEKANDDDKVYWHIKSWLHTFELKEKSDIVFENLYGGNEVLGQAVRELVASSGNDIIKEIGWPMVKVTAARVVRNINNFFKSIPVEDLSLK